MVSEEQRELSIIIIVFTTSVKHMHEPRGKIPESVGEANEGQCNDVMHHHHS